LPLSLAGALLALPAAAPDLEQIKSRGVIRVVVAGAQSPQTVALFPGAAPGVERELIESFARVQGLRLDVVKAPGYADRIPLLLRGEGDVIVAIFDTEDPRRQVDFTGEVMPPHNVAVNRAPAPPVRGLQALAALPAVGAIKGAKPAEAALESGVPSGALRLFASRDALLSALKGGQVAAVVLPVSELPLASREFPGLQAA